MQPTPLSEVQPGMILSRPVEDPLGRVLVKTGEPLTAELIRVLARRGYSEVCVGTESSARQVLSPAAYQAELDKLTQSFKHRFSGAAETSPPQCALMRASLRVLVDRLAAGQGQGA